MKICPICKEQYEGDNCPGCFVKENEVKDSTAEWVHLTTAANDIELGIIAGLLEMAGIPVNGKAIGIDRYVGAPLAGLNVMVPSDRYEEALQVLNAEIDDEEFMTEELESEIKDQE